VARADGTTEAVQPVWAAGRGTPGYESNATLAVQAPAVYTDPRAFQWTTATDWLGFGTAVQAADPLGAVTLAYRDPNGLAWLSADALGRRGRDFFDGLGNATKIVAADNSFEQYAYNGFSEPTRYTDALGNVTTYAYDGQGNLLTETLPDPDGPGPLASPVYTFTCTPRGFVRTATDPLGRTTTYGYDGRNRLASVTNPLGQSVTYGYDAASNLTSETNELAKTWAYTYDNMGRVLTEVLPDDNPNLHPTYTYVYDADGNRTGVTDPDGRVTTTSYDTMDRESVVTDPLLHTTTSYYDPAGNLMGVMDHQGHSISYGYDPAGRRTSVTDANGNQTTYAYDAAGQLVSETDPVLGATTFSYTRTGRLASRTDPLNHTVSYGYDLDGRQTSVTDALGHTTVSAYDADGRLTAVTDPNNGVVRYTYYADGSQASITDPVNNTTNYAYDAAGRLQTATDPLGHATAYAYDAAGRLTSITDRDGRTRTFSYNAEGWQTAENWLDGQGQPIYTISYAYDPAGRLTSVSDPDATCAYGYDAAGRLTAVDNAGTPGVPHVVLSYGYDAVNNRVSLTDSLGAGIQYTYDYGHRLTGASLNGTGLTGVFVSFAYDAHDRLTGLTRSGGGTGSHTITTSYSYDNADRLTGITDTDTTASTTLASYSYGYDAADRVTSYSGPEGSLAYSYDATNQLTGATGVRNESYSYDLNGNRTMPGYQTGPDNRLVSDGTYNYTYDNEGNTLTKTRVSDGQVTTFTWDHRNRLTEAVVKTSGGVTLNDEKFTYDANDHRIGTWANGAQQSWTVYDGDTPYLDFTGSGSLTTRYLSDPRAIDAFFAREDGAGNVAWLLTDKLGSVREVVDSGGTVLDAITYDSYGNILNETNAANGGSFKFTAGAYDSALGLTYLWHRYVANGHWLSEDPLGLGPDSNPNRYVDNSPTNSIDPDGLCPRSRWRGGCWPPPAYPCPPWGGMGPYGPPACFPPPPCWTPPAPKPAPTLPPGRLMPNADGIIMIPSTPAYRELRSELIEFINAHKVVVRGQAPDEDGPKRPSPYPSSIPETPRFFRFTPWFSPSQVDRRTHPVLWKFLNFYKGDAAFSGIMHVDPSYFEKKRDEESSIQVGVKFQWGGPKPPP